MHEIVRPLVGSASLIHHQTECCTSAVQGKYRDIQYCVDRMVVTISAIKLYMNLPINCVIEPESTVLLLSTCTGTPMPQSGGHNDIGATTATATSSAVSGSGYSGNGSGSSDEDDESVISTDGADAGDEEQPQGDGQVQKAPRNPLISARRSAKNRGNRTIQMLDDKHIEYEEFCHSHHPERLERMVPPACVNITLTSDIDCRVLITGSGVFNQPDMQQHLGALAQLAQAKRLANKVNCM